MSALSHVSSVLFQILCPPSMVCPLSSFRSCVCPTPVARDCLLSILYPLSSSRSCVRPAPMSALYHVSSVLLQILCPPCSRGEGLPPSIVFLAGGLGGIMHYVTCFPLDVVKVTTTLWDKIRSF